MRRAVRRGLVAVLGGVLVVFVVAPPAGADPAKPTDFESEVTRVEPASPAITIQVVGGDGFLELTVQRGHDVVVKGYAGGPWLHVRPDGIVEENQLSPATFLNGNRYARVTVPAEVTADSELNQPPQYQQVATGGTFAWHDHRIHWMSPDDPPNHARGDVIYDDWQVFLTVDGVATVAHGRLVWKKAESPLPWIALGIVAAVVVFLAGRGRSTFVAALAMAIASAGALLTGIVAYRSIPAAAGPNPLEIVLPSVAVFAALVAFALHRKPIGVVAVLASLAAVTGWGIMRITVLLHPVLPTDLPFWLDRSATTVALGCSLAAALAAVRSGALVPRLPDLGFDDDEDDEPGTVIPHDDHARERDTHA